jgi:hypothetical protein
MSKMSEPKMAVAMFVPALFSAIGLLLAGLLAIHAVTKIPFEKFTADPAATFGYNPIFGYISSLGILMWCSCVSICFFSARILKKNNREGQMVKFLVCFGALTAVLMLDDLFMFHESLAPDYLNISEKWVILAYGIFTAASFYYFRTLIFANNMRYLIFSIIALGSSVLVDQISNRIYFPGEYFVEDGLKFIGIAGWLAYFGTLAFDKVMMFTVNANQRVRNRRGSRQKVFIYN